MRLWKTRNAYGASTANAAASRSLVPRVAICSEDHTEASPEYVRRSLGE